MKILHTSDWHLGRSLYGRKRYDEFTRFLDWLIDTIKEQEIDILLVAGDVFDTTTPSNYAQQLYYRFLYQVSQTACQHIVIIAGNHDSPSFLNAPKTLLAALNVYVVGAATENPEEEVLLLRDQDNKPQALVCAVPYLREKDIRQVEAGESVQEKSLKLIEGLKSHYERVCGHAYQQQQALAEQGFGSIPIIAMGHLFTAGGKTMDGDGVRELYVGSLAYMGQDLFPEVIDYLALGHLHVPQQVGDKPCFRYSGSPLPMGFGEARQTKLVLVVDFDQTEKTDQAIDIDEITVPCFQELKQIAGTLEEINTEIEQLKAQDSQAWLEIEYTGKEVVADLWQIMEDALQDSQLEILRIKKRPLIIAEPVNEDETLDDMDEYDVFERCLQVYEVPEENREELMQSYKEIIRLVQEEDSNAL